MFVRHLTRWLRLPGLARSAESVWVTPRGVKPDVINVQRVSPQFGYYFVHTWAGEADMFEPVEQMFASVGGELVAHPVTAGDRTDPVIEAFLDERLWLWQVPVIGVDAPAVFPDQPTKPGQQPGSRVDRGVIEVRVVDEVGQPVVGIDLEIERSGKRTTLPTNGVGAVRITEVEESFALVRVAPESPVRDELRARWAKPRGKPWLDITTLPARTEVPVLRLETFSAATVFLDEPHTIILQPRVVQLVLHGMSFETSKCFLLPSAIGGIEFIVEHSRERPTNDLLIVGHTDTSGARSYNTTLSLERAKAAVAYMRRNVEAWYALYGQEQPNEKRWGKHEDDLMIGAIAERKQEALPAHTSPVTWYQGTRGLQIDGIAGPETRHRLIDEYMKLAERHAGAEVPIEAHGCGEDFPPAPTEDGLALKEARSIEVFLFENPIAPSAKPSAVLPEPPGKTSAAGAREYPEWVLRARETHHYQADWEPPERALLIAWDTDEDGALPPDLAFELSVEEKVVGTVRWADASSDGGRRSLIFQPVMPTDKSSLTAVFGDARIVMWKDQIVGPSKNAISWQHTLRDLLFAETPEDQPSGGSEMPPDWHDDLQEEGDDR